MKKTGADPNRFFFKKLKGEGDMEVGGGGYSWNVDKQYTQK